MRENQASHHGTCTQKATRPHTEVPPAHKERVTCCEFCLVFEYPYPQLISPTHTHTQPHVGPSHKHRHLSHLTATPHRVHKHKLTFSHTHTHPSSRTHTNLSCHLVKFHTQVMSRPQGQIQINKSCSAHQSRPQTGCLLDTGKVKQILNIL